MSILLEMLREAVKRQAQMWDALNAIEKHVLGEEEDISDRASDDLLQFVKDGAFNCDGPDYKTDFITEEDAAEVKKICKG